MKFMLTFTIKPESKGRELGSLRQNGRHGHRKKAEQDAWSRAIALQCSQRHDCQETEKADHQE